jgi:hypothetical protein
LYAHSIVQIGYDALGLEARVNLLLANLDTSLKRDILARENRT